MKKFLELTTQFKFVWSLFFTAAMMIYITVSMLLGNSTMELIIIWQFVGITLILTFFHYLIFGEFILNSLDIKHKIIIHFFLCYITLLISTILLKWVSILNFNSLIIFTVSYTILYLLCIFSFYVYYRFTGEELNNRLTTYKKEKNNNKGEQA